ncbi:MAG: isochorismatase family protein, partial [Abditibacteriota bacterium]|nr:isochorismatase family protein [Abditibacteriota bacterium]
DATGCVKSTCFNMRKAGYTVHVISDCVTSYDLKKIDEMLTYYAEKGCEVTGRTALPCRMVLEAGGESAASEGTDHFFVLPEREAVLYVNGVCRGKRRFAPQTGTEVWAESGFARVFPNTPPGRKSIALCAPRGGRVSFQLCARSVKPEDLALKAGAFTSERGKIGPGCISLRHNRYIWLDRPSDTVIRDGEHLIASEIPCEGPLPGLWADVLVPCDRLRISPDRTEALWADIRVPEDAPPGLYRGRIFAGSGAVSVSLRVYPVRLPEGGGLKCSFSFVESLARKVMGKDFSPRKAAEFLRSCGLDYHDAGSTGTETGYHASSFVLTNAAEEEDGLYTLYNPPGAYDASFLRRFAQRLEKPYAFLLERGMADKAYVYGFDERGPEYYGAIKKTFGMVHSRFPGLKTLSTAVIPPEICPFDMGIDAYVALDGRLSREQMKMQKEKGGEYWWYVCGNRRFAVENTLISDRLLFWQTKREGLDGFFYWALNFWDKEDNSPLEQERSEYVFDISGGPCHGDGRLLYPGENGAILSSPRFEQILLGLEDHRLLSLYEEKYGAKKTRALIDSLCPGTGAYHTDPGAFDKARRQLLEGLGNKEKL